jgi:diguanylate cyclase (GGDEF)-like protein
VTLIGVVAYAVAALPSVPIARLAIITPIAYFVAIISDLATATVLLATWHRSAARRSTLVLALAFVSSAAMLLGAGLVLPLLPSVPAVLDAPQQLGIWLFLFWHAVVAVGAFAYIIVLRLGDRAPSRRFTLGASCSAFALVACCYAAAFAFSDNLSPLASGTSLTALVSTGIGPALAIVLAIAALLAFRIREPTTIDRAYALSVLCLCVELSVLLIDPYRYTIIFYCGRILVLIGATLVLIAAERSLMTSRSRLVEMESTLDKVEGESMRRAGRVRAVWQIASYPEKSDIEDFAAILEIAALALRPGKAFFGLLCHLDRGLLIIDATSLSAFESSAPAAARALYPGASFPQEQTMAHLLRGEGHARAWDDFHATADASMVAEHLGFRSFIGAPIAVADSEYFVTFTSPMSTNDEPYEEDDLAYAEVIASFFASRFQQQHHIERIQFQLQHDALTGLLNRVHFRTATRDAIRTGKPFAIALLDLDGFRHVNEQAGNEIGDELLVEVAAKLSGVANGDAVARMSADEFGIIMYGAASLAAVEASIERYANVFRRPFQSGDRLGSQQITIAASVGAARFPDDGGTPEDLMRRADVALDVAKKRAPSSVVVFDPAMEAIAEEARTRVAELAAAIANDQLALVYQPTFDLATRAVIGAEALVRWDHPLRGRLPPAEFIELAERTGLVVPLSRWVCDRVVRDLSTIRELPAGFRTYFNLAAQLLEDVPFISHLKELLQLNPWLVPHLGIEVTETVVMENMERSMSTLNLFRRWGLTVAIDDFGTGYSSLSYLKRLTVDVIKIDRSFVTGLPDDERDCAITEMLLRMTTRFGYDALAEGIETAEQLAWLLAHGCRFGQGYLVARPQPLQQLLECFPEALDATTIPQHARATKAAFLAPRRQ